MNKQRLGSILTIVLGMLHGCIFAQTNPVAPADSAAARIEVPTSDVLEMFDVEKTPAFPGGEAAMMQYLSNNIKYPSKARNNLIEGSVIVTFVVERDGKVSTVKLIRDIGGGCGEEAVRVVSAMPNWEPGSANGHPVRVRYTLPIRFKLTGKGKKGKQRKPEKE